MFNVNFEILIGISHGVDSLFDEAQLTGEKNGSSEHMESHMHAHRPLSQTNYTKRV